MRKPCCAIWTESHERGSLTATMTSATSQPLQPQPALPRTDVPHLQYAALCYRIRDGKLQILLVRSRGGRRWTLPKGWPMRGRTPAEAAAREAWEEAGARGRIQRNCVGGYHYRKRGRPQRHLALVFPMEVTRTEKRYPERTERKRRWVGRKRAARMVQEGELAELLLRFEPPLARH